MKKILCLILTVVMILFCFCGCDKTRPVDSHREIGSFVCIEHDSSYNYWIYCHKDTKVMYFSTGNGLTLMVNSDGTPMVWEEK